MITIGFSTRTDNQVFIKHLRSTCGVNNVQVIQKINEGDKSLSEVYNEIIGESVNDIVVLCHDDILFDTRNWGKQLLKNFEKNDYGIIGLAGSVYLSETGSWWEKRMTMRGIVNHQKDGKKWESKFSSTENKPTEVLLIDGLFISFDKTKIVNGFDEEIKGFHFYDLAFSFSNHLSGVKIGVTYDIRVTHQSIGETNDQWEVNKAVFVEKFKDNLPAKLDVDANDITTYIICHDQVIIKKNIESGKYNSLGNIEYLLVGNGEFTDKESYDNVTIVRDLKYNIEQYPKFTAFTAWYAIWRNDLCHTKYINLLEYDTNITNNYAYFLNNAVKTNPKFISYFPMTMRNSNFINTPNWITSIFAGIKKVYKIDMMDHMIGVINANLRAGQEPIWSTTNNVCFSRETFVKYMLWVSPLIQHMKDDEYSGHNQERAITFFLSMNRINPYYYVGEIEHVQADSHKTQGHVVTKTIDE